MTKFYAWTCTHFASLTRVYAVMEPGRPVTAYSAQYCVTIKFWNDKNKNYKMAAFIVHINIIIIR